MSCAGSHLEFYIHTKNETDFVKDHPRHIPAKFVLKWFSRFREEEF
jgi:hypothetical protein